MALKSRNNYAAFIEIFFIAFVLIGGTLVFLAHLIFAGDWSIIFSGFGLAFASFGFFFLILLCSGIVITSSYFYGLFWRERRLSAAAQGDSRFLTTATNQPDQTLALQPGETVSLERRRSVKNIFTLSLVVVIGGLICALSGEAIVFILLPTFSHSTLNPFYFSFIYGGPPAAPHLTTLDWITAVFPLALGLLFIAYLPILLADQRHKLSSMPGMIWKPSGLAASMENNLIERLAPRRGLT